MKNILCYGDSLTWGYNAETLSRHPFDVRWPNVLQAELGSGMFLYISANNAFRIFQQIFNSQAKLIQALTGIFVYPTNGISPN